MSNLRTGHIYMAEEKHSGRVKKLENEKEEEEDGGEHEDKGNSFSFTSNRRRSPSMLTPNSILASP